MLVETREGEPLSLLLGLKRNSRDQLDVRVAEGAQVYDGRRVWSLERSAEGLAVVDRVSGERVRFAAGPSPHVLAVHQRDVFVEGPDGSLTCSMKDGRCGLGEPPELPLEHPGPGKGFRLALEHGTLRVFLPQEHGGGVVLATGVARLLGVYWVRGGTGEADAVVHRTFRGRARVHALARDVTPDGDLSDWPGAAPLVVDAPWQLQAGGEGWQGERDASFSVAAVWTADHVCLGGRVRDDALGPDDLLTVQLDTVTRAIPLGGAPPDGASVKGEWLGAAWETCFPSATIPPRERHPLAVTLTDADPAEPATVLSSAPTPDGVPLGELILDAPDAE